MRRATATAIGLLVLVTAPTRAAVWEDPDLATALARAVHVVRGRAPAEGARGRPTVTFRVEVSLKGAAPGTALEVGGLHDPSASPGPVFAPDEQVWLIVVKDDETGALRMPTPTFGRYPLREGQVVHATPRDTYLRLSLPEDLFVALVRLHLGQRDAAWLDALRRHLDGVAPTEPGPPRALAFVGLEALALVGEEADAARAERLLDPAGPFQLRVSACRALARSLGARAAPRLVKVVQADPEPAVRSAAADLLARAPGPPSHAGEGLARRLVALVAEAPAEPVRFVGPNDPRLNAWPSPRVALLRAIGRAGPAPVRADLLALLDGPAQPLEVFSEVLRALLLLDDDRALSLDLAARLRPDDSDEPGDDLRNRELCAALTMHTRLEHGLDVARWRAWAAEQRARQR